MFVPKKRQFPNNVSFAAHAVQKSHRTFKLNADIRGGVGRGLDYIKNIKNGHPI